MTEYNKLKCVLGVVGSVSSSSDEMKNGGPVQACAHCESTAAEKCPGKICTNSTNVWACSEALRMQELRTPLVVAQGYQRFPLFMP